MTDNTDPRAPAPKGASILRMHVYRPVGHLHDAAPDRVPADAEEDWPARVVAVSETAGWVTCPDCMDGDDLSEAELLDPAFDGDHSWARENDHPADCVLCKDTGKMWVSL